MARRKQQKPRHLESSQQLATSLQNGICASSESEDDDEHVCGRCRAEFPSLTDFLKHKQDCLSKRPVVVMSDGCLTNDEDYDPPQPPLTSVGVLPDYDSGPPKTFGAKISDLPQLVQQLSDTNVTLEELRNTTVAVAQHGRLLHESQLAVLLSNIHQQQVAQLHVIQELQAQILGVPSSPKSMPLVGTAALTPPQSGSEGAMGMLAHNGSQPSAPISSRTTTYSGNTPEAGRNKEPKSGVSHEPNTLELLQRHTERALLNTMSGGSFFLSNVNSSSELSRLKRSKDGKIEESRHRCRFCGKMFGSDSSLQIHIRSHTGERPFKCSVCGSSFSTKGNLKVHFQRHRERLEIPADMINGDCNDMSLTNGEHSQSVNASDDHQQNEDVLDFSAEMNGENSPNEIHPTMSHGSRSNTPNEMSNLSDDSGDSMNGAVDYVDDLRIDDQQYEDDEDGASDYSRNENDGDAHRRSTLTPPSTFSPFFRPTSFSGTLSDNNPLCLPSQLQTPTTCPTSISNNESLTVVHQDPFLYQDLLPRIGSNDNSWESLMEVTETSETSKLQKLVDNIDVMDPNQCIICQRVLSCKSALQMHYRTHTGERPFRCKICGRAFTTKGNLKTHMSVHRHKSPSRILHQCPVCHKQFANSIILNQHVRMHTTSTGALLHESMFSADNKHSTLLPPSYPRPMLMPPLMSNAEPLALVSSSNRLHIEDTPPASNSDTVIKATEQIASNRSASSPPGSISSTSTHSPGALEVPNQDDTKPLCLEKGAKSPEVTIPTSSLSNCSSPINMTASENMDSDRKPKLLSPKSSYENMSNSMKRPDSKPRVDGENNSPTIHPTEAASLVTKPSAVKPESLQHLITSLANDKPLPMTLPSDCPIPLSMQQHSDRHMLPLNIPSTTVDFTASLAALENHVKGINSNTTSPLPFPPPLGLGFAMQNFYRHDFGSYHNKDKIRDYSPSNKNDAPTDDKSGSSSANEESSKSNALAKSENGALDLTPRGSSQRVHSSANLNVFSHLAGLPFPSPHSRLTTTCQICFKTFACQSALEIHYRSHTKERPFKCDVCDRGFSTKGNMKQHMLTHKIRDLPPQLFTSTPIPITSVPSPVLTTASMESTPSSASKKYDEPSKRSPSENGGGMQTPRRPPGMPKHVCEVCQKPFSSGSALQIHMRTHTGVKPFQCNICSRAFTTKGNLKVHMGTHLSSSGTSRRGRRMSLDISPLSLPLGKPSDYPPPRHDIFFPYLSPFINGMTHPPPPKMNEISVIQSAGNREESLTAVTSSPMTPISLESALPLISGNHRPLSLMHSTESAMDLKGRYEDETNQKQQSSRPKDSSSSSAIRPIVSEASLAERGASWGWKIACNRCNKICSSSIELEIHISNEHMKNEARENSGMLETKS